MPRKLETCAHCRGKFKRVKSHHYYCNSLLAAESHTVTQEQNIVPFSAHAQLVKSMNEFWDSLSISEKAQSIAIFMGKSKW